MPGRCIYPRSERLTRRGEYLSVYRDGVKRVGRTFICYVARREGQGRKFGCAVSRKVGNAVVRNRVKRYLREIYRAHREALPEDAHVVLVARPAAARATYHDCHTAVIELLRRGQVFHG